MSEASHQKTEGANQWLHYYYSHLFMGSGTKGLMLLNDGHCSLSLSQAWVIRDSITERLSQPSNSHNAFALS